MKQFFLTTLAALFLAAPVYSQESTQSNPPDDGVVKLVYPIEAAEGVKIDSSATLNRILPPTLEEAEVDPVTPLGQIRSVLENLESLKRSQEELANKLKGVENVQESQEEVKSALKGLSLGKIEERLTDATNERLRLVEDLKGLRQTIDEDGAKIKDLIGLVSAIPAVKSKLSTLSDYCVVLVLVYVVVKLLSSLIQWVANLSSTMNDKIMAKAVEKAKEQLLQEENAKK